MPNSEDVTICSECYALVARQHAHDHQLWHEKLERLTRRVLGEQTRPSVTTPPRGHTNP
jgi:hypothetical protein